MAASLFTAVQEEIPGLNQNCFIDRYKQRDDYYQCWRKKCNKCQEKGSQNRSNMANLFKAYSFDGDCYSILTTDIFGRKFMLFIERCAQADNANKYRCRAFSIMLTGSSKQFYFDSIMSKTLDLFRCQSL